MSSDNPQTSAPVAMTSKGGRKKFFLFGGMGCFVFVLLCGGGGLFVYKAFVQPLQQLVEESAAEAEVSQVALDELGAPVIVVRREISQRNDRDTMYVSLPISGAEKSGTLVIEAYFDEDRQLKRKGLILKVDDQEIDLLAEDPLGDIDIDIPEF